MNLPMIYSNQVPKTPAASPSVTMGKCQVQIVKSHSDVRCAHTFGSSSHDLCLGDISSQSSSSTFSLSSVLKDEADLIALRPDGHIAAIFTADREEGVDRDSIVQQVVKFLRDVL